MRITIETKARPCPGVERAVSLAEDILRRGERVIAVGELIHNSREIDRLRQLGLEIISEERFLKSESGKSFAGAAFLLRAHGETEKLIRKAKEYGMRIIDATCPIVQHSQDLVSQHASEGLGIIIVGNPGHPEVKGLVERGKGCVTVISTPQQAERKEFEERSLLLAQSTVDPDLFHEICRILSRRLSVLKIIDTTCRFLRTRKSDVKAFAEEQDMIILIGGRNSSNCSLLYETARHVNTQTHWIEKPADLDWSWFKNGERVGITGGASTPKWQMDEIRSVLENHPVKTTPRGVKNKKGGPLLWRMLKKQKTKK